MFSVIFEVHPHADQWDTYLATAKMLRPELQRIDGFVDNERYRSLTREGWILSLSGWRDEKAVVRWRTQMRHHEAQEKGRAEIFAGYHLRVGQVTRDTHVPAGHTLREQRLDETEVGEAGTVSLVDTTRPSELIKSATPAAIAESLGWLGDDSNITSWDVFDAVLAPGDVILLVSWRSKAAADSFEVHASEAQDRRVRQVRVVRDYGMFDRREAPQYFPDARGGETVRS